MKIKREIENLLWSDLSFDEQTALLRYAQAIDGVTGNETDEDGEWIIDLNETYSVEGKVIDGEIVIDGNSKIYKPGD